MSSGPSTPAPPKASGTRGLFRDTVWNALSNLAAASLGALTPILAARVAGAYWCGVVALATAMSQQLFNIGSFATNGYQASDVSERHPFVDYVLAKVFSVAVMLAVAAAWIGFDWPGRDKTVAFAAMMLFQASEAFSGAFFSRYQQKGRLDTACRIRFAKALAFMAVYAGVILAAKRALPALCAAACVHALLFLFLDLPLLRFYGPLWTRPSPRSVVSILIACAPLAASAFFLIYLHNGPRFAVDALLDEIAFAKFTALFMISFAVATCADFLINPHLVPLAEAVRRGDRRTALRTLLQPLVAILVLGSAAVALAAPVGIPALSLLFGLDLSGHASALRFILLGGTLVPLYALFQMGLVVLRKQAWCVPGLVLAVAATLSATYPLTAKFGLQGAALAYAGAAALLAMPTAVVAAVFFRRLSSVGPSPARPSTVPPPAKTFPDAPCVSVLVPVYNAGPFLRRCLDSLAAQTFTDFEAIALDDGSTDGSLDILRAFAADHPFLKVETQPNAGAPATRNRLIRMARGRYVMFIDDDDTYDPDCIGRFVAEALRTGADLVAGGYRRVSPDGRILNVVRMTDPQWSPLVVIVAWCKIYRRSLLIENHVEFLDYGIGEDIYFSFMAYRAAQSMVCFDYAGYNWTFNETSVSNTAHRTFRPELDPVPLFDRLVSVSGTGGLYPLFYVRHVVWHLLYSGRGVPPAEFLRQEKRFFAWLAGHGIPLRYPFSRRFLRAGDFKIFLLVRFFLAMRRLRLLPLFARLYCRPPHGPHPESCGRA